MTQPVLCCAAGAALAKSSAGERPRPGVAARSADLAVTNHRQSALRSGAGASARHRDQRKCAQRRRRSSSAGHSSRRICNRQTRAGSAASKSTCGPASHCVCFRAASILQAGASALHLVSTRVVSVSSQMVLSQLTLSPRPMCHVLYAVWHLTVECLQRRGQLRAVSRLSET